MHSKSDSSAAPWEGDNNIGALLFAELAGVEFETNSISWHDILHWCRRTADMKFERLSTLNGEISGIRYAVYRPDLAAMEAALQEKGLLITMLTTLDAAGRPLEGDSERVSVFEGMRRVVFSEAAASRAYINEQEQLAQKVFDQHRNLQAALEATQQLIDDQYESLDAMLTWFDGDTAPSPLAADIIRTFVSSREDTSAGLTRALVGFKDSIKAELAELERQAVTGELQRARDVYRLLTAAGRTPLEFFTNGREEYASRLVNPLVRNRALAEILHGRLTELSGESGAVMRREIEKLELELEPLARFAALCVDGFAGLLLVGGRNVGPTDVETAKRVLEAYGLMWSNLYIGQNRKSDFSLGIPSRNQNGVRNDADAEATDNHDTPYTDDPPPFEFEILGVIEDMFRCEEMFLYELDYAGPRPKSRFNQTGYAFFDESCGLASSLKSKSLPYISAEGAWFLADRERLQLEKKAEGRTEREEARLAALDTLYSGDGSFDVDRAAALFDSSVAPWSRDGAPCVSQELPQASAHPAQFSIGAANHTTSADLSVQPRVELQRRIRAKPGDKLIYKNPDTGEECEAAFEGYGDSSHELSSPRKAFIWVGGLTKAVETSTLSVVPTDNGILARTDTAGQYEDGELTQEADEKYDAPFPRSPNHPEAEAILECQRKQIGDLFRMVDMRDGYPPQVEMIREPSEAETLTLKVIYITAPSNVSGFVTRQGSRYKVSGRCTQRVAQSDWPSDSQSDCEDQPPSRTTYYLTHNDLQHLALLQTSCHYVSIWRVGYRMIALFHDSGTDKGTEIRGTRATAYPNPSIGLFPLQVWGHGITRRYHFGNQIVSISYRDAEILPVKPVATAQSEPVSATAGPSTKEPKSHERTRDDVEREILAIMEEDKEAGGDGTSETIQRELAPLRRELAAMPPEPQERTRDDVEREILAVIERDKEAGGDNTSETIQRKLSKLRRELASMPAVPDL